MKCLIQGLLFLGLVAPVFGQETITLASFEKLYLENNPFLKVRKAELTRSDGQVLIAQERPNPVFRAEVESLKNGEQETEASFLLSQELDLKRVLPLQVRSVKHVRMADHHRLDHEIRSGLAEQKKKFFKTLQLKEDISGLQKILAILLEFTEKSSVRLQNGDIAEVDVMKLMAEKQKILRLLGTMQSQCNLEKKGLALALGLGSTSLDLQEPFTSPFPQFRLDDFVRVARENRSDLREAQEKLRGTAAAMQAAKREVGSPIELEAGYKTRTGGFNGFILGISTPLPWSNKNRGKIAILKSEEAAEQLRLKAIEETLVGGIGITLEKLEFLRGQHQEQIKQIEVLREITKIARTSYEEGETDLIEVLDGIRAENELTLEVNQTIYESRELLFDLEALTGKALPGIGETQ